jgi:DNA-binding NarL/FixJ family response regulator
MITGSVIDYRTMLPDVVIMDIAMPGLSDIETTRRLLAGHPNIKVLALCTGLIWS